MNSVHLDAICRGLLKAGNGANQGSPGNQGTMMIIMFVLIGLSFYFIILRPQKKEQHERKRMLDNIKKGDKVVSIGGIHGTVVEVQEQKDVILVEVAKNVRLKFLRSAISTIADDSKTSK